MSAKQIGTIDPLQQSVINKQKGKVCITQHCSTFLSRRPVSMVASNICFQESRGCRNAILPHLKNLKHPPNVKYPLKTLVWYWIYSFLGPLLEVFDIRGGKKIRLTAGNPLLKGSWMAWTMLLGPNHQRIRAYMALRLLIFLIFQFFSRNFVYSPVFGDFNKTIDHH